MELFEKDLDHFNVFACNFNYMCNINCMIINCMIVKVFISSERCAFKY